MRCSIRDIFLLLAVFCQAMVSIASAKGVMLCIHPDGVGRIENHSYATPCEDVTEWDHANDISSAADIAICSADGAGCTDVLLPTFNARPQTGAVHPPEAVSHFELPPFLLPATLPSPVITGDFNPAFKSTYASAAQSVLTSLSSVILLI